MQCNGAQKNWYYVYGTTISVYQENNDAGNAEDNNGPDAGEAASPSPPGM
jgi:hypothetical protein